MLLFYKYITIDDREALRDEQRRLCELLGLTGRIIVATEGINATVEGTKNNTQKYIDILLADKRFADTHIKRSAGTGTAFPKLSVKARDEIVSGHLDYIDVNPTIVTGKYLSAEELHQWVNSNREFYIVDMRNGYEQKSGYFKDSVLSEFTNFRDLPSILPKLESLKHKTIVTVCTGGVRCEKASGFLVNNGFTDVYQLSGGIVTYMEAYPNEDFLGKLYVFDNRIVMGFNTDSPDHVVIGKCDLCGVPSDHYVNCANLMCHDHFICCENCLQNDQAFCSSTCRSKCETATM